MSSSQNLLLFEADKTLLNALSRLLREVCRVETVQTSAAALERLDKGRFDIVLIDVDTLPDEGIKLCHQISARELPPPVLLLAGPDFAISALDGTSLDPDDIVAKPLRMAVLVGKIEARLRRNAQSLAKQIGPFAFYGGDRCLFDPTTQKTIRLTEKERDILDFLLTNGSGPVPREALLAEIWGYSPLAATHTLETHIYRLRQKLMTAPDQPTILVSEAGGYRLAV